MASLQDWESKFGTNDKFSASNRVGFDFELDVAYRVEVKSAKIIETRRKDICLQLELSILDGADEVGTTREWITLPKQASDEKMPGDTVRKLTFRRRDDLQRILSVAQPEKFAVYVDRKQEDGKAIYIGPDGKEMSFGEFKEREKEVNSAVMELTDAWHEEVGAPVEDLSGASFYMVKAPNKRNADYPYTNVYNFKPEKIPVFGEAEEEAPF